MSSLAVKLPINKDSINGYKMIDNFEFGSLNEVKKI